LVFAVTTPNIKNGCSNLGQPTTTESSSIVKKILVILIAFTLAMPNQCFGCMWDYDTLAMERQHFPEAHELIAGHFIHHSEAYYQWRILDRTSKPEVERTPNDFDDLAVAYDKLGQHEKAIETIRAKIERWREKKRYESEANLGTFLIHAGNLEEGLEHIKRAIEINPEAHFGREIYQQLIVEYVLMPRTAENASPLNRDNAVYEATGFGKFVIESRKPAATQLQQMAEFKSAAKGVMGMMRFGHHDSPILLEALGDLLLRTGENSKRLAARAYLKASYELDDDKSVAAFRLKAEQALELQVGSTLEWVEAELKQEIETGRAFMQRIAQDEEAWAESGLDLDVNFAKKYYTQPSLMPFGLRSIWQSRTNKILIISLGLVALIGTRRFFSKKRREKNAEPQP
jgi:tetratricopeptide (TPR) repeat protein